MKQISLKQLIFIIIIAWIITGIVLWLVFKDWQKSAAFGDTFGFINSLFSGLALAAIIYTIYLQKNELELQRKELKFTRKELSRTANAQEQNLKMINEQLRLSSLPIVQFESRNIDSINYIIINNSSQNAAFDVDINIFQGINSKSIKLEEFINEFVKNNRHDYYNKRNINEDLFYLSERGVYHSFLPKKRILIPIEYPINSNSPEVLIQYRDGLNNNYTQSIKFKKSNARDKPYEFSIYRPKIPTIMERVDLIEHFRIQNPPILTKEYCDKADNSISVSSLIDKTNYNVEGRWPMKDIR